MSDFVLLALAIAIGVALAIPLGVSVCIAIVGMVDWLATKKGRL